MTYRRLFHILLIGSTILLVALWWLSIFWQSYAELSSRTAGCLVTGVLYCGTMELKIVDGNTNDVTFRGGSEWRPEWVGEPSLRPSPWGNFDLGQRKRHGFRIGGPSVYHLSFPLWTAYLLFVGGTWVLMRLMERRTTREKELAGNHVLDTLERAKD